MGLLIKTIGQLNTMHLFSSMIQLPIGAGLKRLDSHSFNPSRLNTIEQISHQLGFYGDFDNLLSSL